MRILIIMIIALLNLVPGFIASQESPSAEEYTEQTVKLPITEETSPEEAVEQEEQITPEGEESLATTTLEETQEKQEEPTEEQTVEESSSSAEASEDTAQNVIKTPSFAATPQSPTEDIQKKVVIPASPQPIADEDVIIPEESSELEEAVGISTIALDNPQGNWLFKRIWWERAEERYEKIRLLVDAIWESRTVFFVKRNELDRNVFDPFYLKVGIGQGELQVILGEINDFLEKKREQQGDLNEQERMLYESYATEEETLKQLKLDIESIANLDRSIDDALGTLMNQINRVRQFEEQAWQNFREIARILNDTKARELYYMIEGAARNIKNISMYLENDLLGHFNVLVSEATKHVSKVHNQIEALKEKGIHFKRQVDLLEQKNQQLQEDRDDEDDEEDVTPKPKLGWFGWIISGFKSVLNTILSLILLPYNMLFGK